MTAFATRKEYIFSLILCFSNLRISFANDSDWDYLLYSQRWPNAACSEWEEQKRGNTCSLPNNSTWIVHGIWPTKEGTEGPNFCKSIPFEPKQLKPVEDNLKTYWTNVEGNTKPYSLWKHEWEKHGTCASVLPQFDTIINYFKQGLVWRQQYDLINMLSKNQVVPNTAGYAVEEIYNAIKSELNKNPEIQCVVDRETRDSVLSEIRICFNRNLELIDCNFNNNNDVDHIKTNCNRQKPVKYLNQIIPDRYEESSIENNEDYDDFSQRIKLYEQQYQNSIYYLKLNNIVKFLMWLTL